MKKLLCLLIVTLLVICSGCDWGFNKEETASANRGIPLKDEFLIDEDKKVLPSVTSDWIKDDIIPPSFYTPSPIAKADKPKNSNLDTEVQKDSIDISKNKASAIPIILYYQDKDGVLIPFTLLQDNLTGIAKLVINALIDSAFIREEIDKYGVFPVLPKNTKLKSLNIVEGIASVDFSSSILNYNSASAEGAIISSIVYTLTQFKNIMGVKILIEGKPQKLKFNTDISQILNRNNILINSEKATLSKQKAKSDAYFFKDIKENVSYIVPVSVEHDIIRSDMLPGKILENLNMDLKSKKFISLIPNGTKLLNSELNKGILVLNFNKAFINYGGNTREDAIIKQLLYSYKQINGIEGIRIKIEGKELALPEGTEAYNIMNFPELINEIIGE